MRRSQSTIEKFLTYQHHAEQTLDSHDLAIPLPQSRQQDPKNFFRIVLISPSDMYPTTLIMGRIERLYHLTGGRNVGIVFLIQDSVSRENGVRTLMTLQAR